MIQAERLLRTFLEYVQISSESTHEAAFAARVKEDLEALGLEAYMDSSQSRTGSDAGNLYAVLPGTCDGEPMIFCAHMDTVVPGVGVEPVVENGVIRSRGDTILGGDDKVGVAALVEMLRVLVESGRPHPAVQVIFTVCEEIGLLGAKALEYDRLIGKRAVVLDSSGDVGRIVHCAPGQYHLRAEVLGRSAHAGLAPEEGISAVQVLAQAISNMKLLRIDEETTANIGAVHADYPPNIVPAKASLFAECRSMNTDKLEKQARHMVSCLEDACAKYGAQLEYHLEPSFTAYHIPQDDPLIRHVIASCEKLGLPWQLTGTGGGSDAHVMNQHGIRAVVLGTGMTKVHTTAEELSVQALNDTARWALTLATM